MDIFLSWSGDTSKRVAELLRDWLPTVIQSVKPWISSRDIRSGQKWFDQVSNTANNYSFGLFCLTPENIDSKWIHFEAGAISNASKESHIVGLLIQGLAASQISGPLSQFQHVELSKNGLEKIVRDINSNKEGAQVSEHVLSTVFERSWPELESQYKNILVTSGAFKPTPERPTQDILKEILQITRDMRYETMKMPKHVEKTLGYVEAQYRNLQKDMNKKGEGLPPAPKAPPINGVRVTAYPDGTTIKKEVPPKNRKYDIYD